MADIRCGDCKETFEIESVEYSADYDYFFRMIVKKKENEFQNLDRILQKRIAQEKIDAQLQKEDREIFQANQLRINRNSSISIAFQRKK